MAYIVGISVLIWLPDSPATATFLSERERIVAIERVRDNGGGTIGSKVSVHT
jgi:ACS family allantoate permease-like MFS transporter